jgi:hypothetical protein
MDARDDRSHDGLTLAWRDHRMAPQSGKVAEQLAQSGEGEVIETKRWDQGLQPMKHPEPSEVLEGAFRALLQPPLKVLVGGVDLQIGPLGFVSDLLEAPKLA